MIHISINLVLVPIGCLLVLIIAAVRFCNFPQVLVWMSLHTFCQLYYTFYSSSVRLLVCLWACMMSASLHLRLLRSKPFKYTQHTHAQIWVCAISSATTSGSSNLIPLRAIYRGPLHCATRHDLHWNVRNRHTALKRKLIIHAHTDRQEMKLLFAHVSLIL